MVFDEVLQPFIEKSPVSVIFRGVLENIFSPQRLDDIFEKSATRQVERQLLFSTCASLMSLVVSGARKSVNAAYREQQKKGEIAVSVKSIYNKLAGIEPAVCERMVRETAADLAQVLAEMKVQRKGPLPGYDVRILDGNHLAASQRRIKELRPLMAAPLPGQTIAVLDPQRKLIEDVILCEDGHANERVMIPSVLTRVKKGQCWIGDTAYCTLDFFFGCRKQKAYFIIRQHQSLKGELIGKRKRLGRTDTGIAYEQTLHVSDRKRGVMALRRITIVRDKPTGQGNTEIHILTNLPAKVSGLKIPPVFRGRWQIENAFQDLATTLRSEINTLGYPDAALFGFSIAVVLFNVFSILKAALEVAAGGQEKLERNLSTYYLADEISGVWRGLEIVVPADCWTATFASLTPKQLAKKLIWLAKKVDIKMFYTNPWKQKKPKGEKIFTHRSAHVSTQRLLEQRGHPQKC